MVTGVGQLLELRLDVGAPALEVRLDDRRLLVVRDLDGPEGLRALPRTDLAAARSTQILYPVRVSARRDQVAPTLVVENEYRHGSPCPALPAAHGKRRDHAEPH